MEKITMKEFEERIKKDEALMARLWLSVLRVCQYQVRRDNKRKPVQGM
jgi:hypothetical protein